MIPCFSIIIPTYNSSETVGNALDSIVTQSFKNFEVLVIDNCSDDKTLEIVKGYTLNATNIRCTSEPDKGIYDAMNKGIRKAKGKWIYFLGSDDKLHSDNVLLDIFKFAETTQAKIIYGNVLIDQDAGWARNGQIYDGEFFLLKLIEKNICHQAMFFDRLTLLKKGGFNLRYSICSDWDMNLRLWASSEFRYTKTIVSVFKGGNSSSKIANNFTETEKWICITNAFRTRLLSQKFSAFSKKFLMLSWYYSDHKKYLKSFLLKIVYLFHNR